MVPGKLPITTGNPTTIGSHGFCTALALSGHSPAWSDALGTQHIFSLRYSFAAPSVRLRPFPQEENALGTQVQNPWQLNLGYLCLRF